MTACLTIQCRHGLSNADLDTFLNRYRALDTSAPGLTVFHTRLGLALIDGIGTVENPEAHRIALDLIHRTTAAQDGYAARDVLAHSGCSDLLNDTQARELTDLIESCALRRGALPTTLLADLTTALTSTEELIARTVTSVGTVR